MPPRYREHATHHARSTPERLVRGECDTAHTYAWCCTWCGPAACRALPWCVVGCGCAVRSRALRRGAAAADRGRRRGGAAAPGWAGPDRMLPSGAAPVGGSVGSVGSVGAAGCALRLGRFGSGRCLSCAFTDVCATTKRLIPVRRFAGLGGPVVRWGRGAGRAGRCSPERAGQRSGPGRAPGRAVRRAGRATARLAGRMRAGRGAGRLDPMIHALRYYYTGV